MEGLYQDTIILLVILFFGFWIINKHYDNAWKIEQLEIKLKKALELGDLTKMQDDIISLKQKCINIDGKYKIKYDWIQKKFEELIGVKDHFDCSISDAVLTVQDAVDLINSGDKDGDK